MRTAAKMSTLDVWYSHMEIGQMLEWIRTEDSDERLGRIEGNEAVLDVAKARTRDSLRAFKKLTGKVDGEVRFVKDPPLLVPLEDLVLSEEARHRASGPCGS